MPRIAVVALGGNAITRAGQAGTHAEQADNARSMATAICELHDAGWVVVVVHGNGPQVGNLAIQQHEAADEVPALPLFVQGAMTQGQLGTLLVVALHQVAETPQPVVSMVTHVVVDADDPAFDHPTKPIGPFFAKDEAERLAAERGWSIVEDSGRGYRQIVASPRPRRILEIDAVRALVEQHMVVIAGGGGGVPVVEDADGYHGVDGVVDKDLTARLMATALGADALVLITDIDRVALDFGTDRQRSISAMTVDEAQSHLDDGQFPPGSMGPKMSAAIEFVRHGGRVAVITDTGRVRATLAEEPGGDVPPHTGTRIVAAASTTVGVTA
ncbi:MAG: carbamate kinase [Pseudonocardia sp.]|nr:carbamate kinase [Pseudonocardia sp.]